MNHSATLAASDSLIVDLLVNKGLLDSRKLQALREAQAKSSAPVESLLVTKGLVSEREIAAAYSEYLLIPLYQPAGDAKPVDRELGRLLPEKLCRDQLVVPVSRRGDTLDVAFVTPNEMLIMDELQLITGLRIRPLIAAFSTVEPLIEMLYSSGRPADQIAGFAGVSQEFERVEDEAETEEIAATRDDEMLLLDQPPPPGRDGRIIRLVNQLLEQALRAAASDIHLEPIEKGCKVRIRVDGVLRELPPPQRQLFIPMVSRFKILAKMDIAERRIPQDGAIALKSGDRRVDLRVSTVPTVNGEKLVMRILDKNAIPLELTRLGLDERQSKDLVDSVQMPHGLLLVTGPTGSGKSTTVYSCLNLLNAPDTNICTVEDPVEYKFDGMNQVQVKTQVGLTFASALRAFLRQDPDVIMVGEVRDQETAQICLRAALTGHLVLSTLHTNDALSAITRLEDMGIEPFLLASTLRALEAQRLIRRLCKDCKEAYTCGAETGQRYGLSAGETLYRPKGCENCRGSGYRGRLGVFEVVRITQGMADLIQTRATLPELRQAAREQGMKLLADSARDKVRAGETSLEEALTVTMSAED